ncbi:beta-ketoacyl-[acyl-carrier-protein] synthase family protein [Solihabitans fulvus]|uniref:Beta-ketoacyl-[acyl-carrier-protein] synthase family protein n=1 Tax=Solihabitans fulvus TaxID=1892852 RepID=A0A5B2X223_9PSEU|nr:beta-ketoacyl synthase N-terminal-like domain-containing protein [Solihabitans fulvus]KAA2257283.1 beta-ketoacyl-[acyl-carrier-protein] synthase family protein [Solihabitans fulvus]
MVDRARVVLSGFAVRSAHGSGQDALLAGAFGGTPAFAPVTRFDTARRRTDTAATMPGAPRLADELVGAVVDACADASLGREHRAGTPLLLAAHADHDNTATALEVAARTGLPDPPRTYTAACVAATSAVADAAAMIAGGRVDRAVVAAGFLVDGDTFAVFDAGRALAADGHVRPFSAGRQGMLLGDAVAAVVLESADSARARRVSAKAALLGWGRTGDAYHVCKPRPDGEGLARAVHTALRRADVPAAEVGYVNANGTGTPQSDSAEAAALRQVFGADLDRIPVSSTKSVHGHALEASGLLELIVTVLALRTGRLPVNAGFLAADEDCRLNLVLDGDRRLRRDRALTVNAAFGGANTALLVGAP